MKQLTTLLLLALMAAPVLAQETQTTFTLTCYEMDSEQHVTIHLGYTSSAVEHYVGSGLDFTTTVGAFPDSLTVTLNAYDPYPALGLTTERPTTYPGITDRITVSIPLTLEGLARCGEVPTPARVPATTPTAAPCAHRAVNSATGEPYCYEPLPGGLVPLPDAS